MDGGLFHFFFLSDRLGATRPDIEQQLVKQTRRPDEVPECVFHMSVCDAQQHSIDCIQAVTHTHTHTHTPFFIIVVCLLPVMCIGSPYTIFVFLFSALAPSRDDELLLITRCCY